MEGSYGTALIKAEQINKNYVLGEITVHALRDISFELYRGELIVILGPSGSGKSTLLNILGGIETATSGRLLYGGKELDWKDKKALTAYRRAHVGFVFQFYNLMPGLTALENVELAAELGEHPLDAGGLMEQVGLADRADHFPSKLSGGQQQRVAIARALINRPAILLADEPTGNLDPHNAMEIMGLLEEINRQGTTVVVVTHSSEIVNMMRKRVITIQRGIVVGDEKESGYWYED